jgi:hypothetical protein
MPSSAEIWETLCRAPALPTSSQALRGRTALLNHSTAGSGMSSSTPNCLPRWLRLRAWPTAGAGSTTTSGPIRPSRGERPWRQLKQLLHNHPLSLRLDHEGGHVSPQLLPHRAGQQATKAYDDPQRISIKPCTRPQWRVACNLACSVRGLSYVCTTTTRTRNRLSRQRGGT